MPPPCYPIEACCSALTSAAGPSVSPPAIRIAEWQRRSKRFRASVLRSMPGISSRLLPKRAQSTRAFARNLARLTELPIALWDERLSTAAVERALIAADASRATRKSVIDQHAAAYILQGALDRLARARQTSL